MGLSGGRQGGAIQHRVCPLGCVRPKLSLLLLCLAAIACGSSGPSEPPPTVPLSGSSDAQLQLRSIQASFQQSSRQERPLFEPRLVAFLERYPNDELVPIAEGMLAWVLLERGQIEEARSRSHDVQTRMQGRGTTADLAAMIEGAALRRLGKPKEALAKLLPLSGKLIDAHARVFLNEEVTASALADKRYDQALDLMLVWLHDAAPDERADVRARLAELCASIPPAALLSVLEPRRRANPDPQGPELDVQTTLVDRLTQAAIAGRDQVLALKLLGLASPLLGSNAEAVADLAAGASGARVEAPTLGLLLPIRTADTRSRGTQVASGLSFALGLPGSGARLVSRDDQGRIEGVDDALGGLSSDGAAIVIAGVDQEEATAAARFAVRESLPVVLLVPPSADAVDVSNSPFVFVLGEEPERIRKLLVAALPARGQTVWVGDKGSVDMSRPEAFECSKPPPSYRGIASVAVFGSCVPDVLLALSGSATKCAVGFDLGGLSLPKGTLAAFAGVFPIDAQRSKIPSVASWLRVHADPPSYWAGLGHDAALLAWAGVQVLPSQGTKDPKEVRARRLRARDALAAASAELWTSEAKGFAGEQRMKRTIEVREAR